MLDSIEPYDIHFIQKASPTSNGDAFDFSYIYKFRTENSKISKFKVYHTGGSYWRFICY